MCKASLENFKSLLRKIEDLKIQKAMFCTGIKKLNTMLKQYVLMLMLPN